MAEETGNVAALNMLNGDVLIATGIVRQGARAIDSLGRPRGKIMEDGACKIGLKKAALTRTELLTFISELRELHRRMGSLSQDKPSE